MKKNLIMIFIITMSFFLIGNVNALTYGRVTNNSTISRTGPGTNYSKSVTLYYNDVVPLFSTTVIKSSGGCSKGWFKVNVNGTNAYVCRTDVSTSNVTVLSKYSTLIRYGAGSNYKNYKTIPRKTNLTLENTTKYKGSGCSKGWYKLHYTASNSRFVCINDIYNYRGVTNGIVTNTKGTAVKKSNSSSSSTVATLKYGQGVTLYETKKFKGKGCSKWYKAYYKNTVRYVCSSDVVNRANILKVEDLDGVNVRSSASSSGQIRGKLSYNEAVVLLNTSKYKGSGCNDGWYKISYNGSPGYVCSAYVSATSNSTTIIGNTDIRQEANSNSKKITTMNKNSVVLLRSTTKYSGSGCSDGWYRISLNGNAAYVCSTYTELGNPCGVINNNNSTSNNNSGSNNSSGDKKITSYKTSSGNYYTISNWTYRLKENYGNIRSSASTASSIQDVVYMGTEFDVLSSSGSSSGCSAGWYKIKYYNNKTGYICRSLVDKYNDVTKNDSSYCNTLKSNGFPASYCPFLSYLHAKHPSWVFKAEKTNINFLNAVNGESERNYTQISTSARSYLASTSVREAGGWRTASDAYVAFMLDPRNYLNEQNIFAFEDLSYDKKYHTSSVVKSIFSGTYLADNSYVNYFMNAANDYKVSPIHLASRVKQEGGSDSNYSAVTGTVKTTWNVISSGYVCAANVNIDGSKISVKKEKNGTNTPYKSDIATNSSSFKYSNGNYIYLDSSDSLTLLSSKKYETRRGCTSGWYKVQVDKSLKNIYNYYNIGAYGSNPVLRGLAAAAGYVDDLDGTPWNTREKAIKYGASFIANGYINKGQDTMYYQKFNTGPNNAFPKYTHQYMTNILAPASESLSTYDSYSSLKLLNNGYVFKIPVYNSMPNEYTTHPPVK